MKKQLLNLTVLFGLSTLLAGCVAPKPRYTWYKEGVKHDEMVSYYRECEYNVGMNHLTPDKEGRLMRACMEKAGFRWVAR